MFAHGTRCSAHTVNVAIGSSSTLDEIKAAYDDNVDYDLDESTTKAHTFIKACRLLLRRLPRSSRSQGSSVDLSPELIQQQMQTAERWIAARGGANADASNGGVKHMSFKNFRE